MSSRREAMLPYAGESLGVRLHVLLRWVSCPFPKIDAAVPETGRILDYGCGHGLLSTWLARAPGRTVVGVDIDEAKIAVARRVGGDRCTFRVSASDDLPAGPFDTVVVNDVLYLLPEDHQRRLVQAAAEVLAPGGVLVVKEMDVRPRWKAAWMRTQERVMVRLLQRTKGSTLAFTRPDVLRDAMVDAGLTVVGRRIDRHYVHPHHLLVGTK